MKKIVLLQTSMVSFETFNRLFSEIVPGAHVSNLVDEDLLNTLNLNKGITPSIIQRICQYCIFAEAADLGLPPPRPPLARLDWWHCGAGCTGCAGCAANMQAFPSSWWAT